MILNHSHFKIILFIFTLPWFWYEVNVFFQGFHCFVTNSIVLAMNLICLYGSSHCLQMLFSAEGFRPNVSGTHKCGPFENSRRNYVLYEIKYDCFPLFNVECYTVLLL